MKALTKIQSELKSPKNQKNTFGKYNYRSCEDILEALKPLLKKHEARLTITDEVKQVGELTFIESTVIFKHAEYDDSIIVKAQAGINPNRKGMDIAQSFGSSSSYARKYALNGMFLIDDTKEIDSIEEPKQVPVSKPKLTPEQYTATLKGNKKNILAVIKKFQLEPGQLNELNELLVNDHGMTVEELK